MSVTRPNRRLSAVLIADVTGYTKLVEEDTEGTVAAWKSARARVIHPAISERDGRIVKLTGDGFLAEFSTVQDAVTCAIAIQEQILTSQSLLNFRMGVHLGDVVDDGEDIHGEGVNIAARIETLADSGGICVSAAVYEQVRNRIDATYEDIGEHEVKHVSAAVRVFRINLGCTTPINANNEGQRLHLDRPSIAVMPFENMSGDPAQEYLADGIAEDILTNLSQINELFVIARNSSFAFKGEYQDLRKVAKDLSVRYFLKGSLRQAGTRLRITAQLIDGTDGSQLWSERYDRELHDIFELQDDITSNITTALQVKLTEGQQITIRRNQTQSYFAWKSYQLAQFHRRQFTLGDNAMARDLVQTALQHDPQFVSALSLLALTYVAEARQPWSASQDDAIRIGLGVIDRAMKLNPDNPEVLSALGDFLLMQNKHEKSENAHRRAVALGPNIADIHVYLAFVLNMRNKPKEAISLIENAMRMCPIYPDFYLGILGISYRLLNRHADAIDVDQRRLRMNPDNVFSDLRLSAIYTEIGDTKQGRHHLDEALKKQPSYRISHLAKTDPYENPHIMRHYENLLRNAGLPE
jgi:TolB-like protein/tetratricopeptide (TPR) repeat protein